MKVLYFGPYYNTDLIGMASRNIIDTIKSNPSIQLETKSIITDLDYVNVDKFENYRLRQSFDSYDYVIQHCPVEMICDPKYISLGEKNICIPMIDYSVSQYQLEVLRNFNTVLVDDYTNAYILSKYNIAHKALVYHIEKIPDGQQGNFDYCNNKTKLYFIGNYLENNNILNKIIISFIISCRNSLEKCMVLALTDPKKYNAQEALEKNIQDIFDKMNYHPILKPIKIINQEFTYDHLKVLHNSCDIFIDLKDQYECGLNRSMAECYNSKILDITNLDHITVPSMNTVDYYIDKHKQSVLTQSIVDALSDLNKVEKHGLDAQEKSRILDILC
jgi:hypothetical protein